MNNTKPCRGEIWLIDLTIITTTTIEQHKKTQLHPCLVISNDIFNHGAAERHVILPITPHNENNPFHIPVKLYEGKLDKEAFILCDQICTVSRTRFKNKSLGMITQQTLTSVEYMIKILLH